MYLEFWNWDWGLKKIRLICNLNIVHKFADT